MPKNRNDHDIASGWTGFNLGDRYSRKGHLRAHDERHTLCCSGRELLLDVTLD